MQRNKSADKSDMSLKMQKYYTTISIFISFMPIRQIYVAYLRHNNSCGVSLCYFSFFFCFYCTLCTIFIITIYIFQFSAKGQVFDILFCHLLQAFYFLPHCLTDFLPLCHLIAIHAVRCVQSIYALLALVDCTANSPTLLYFLKNFVGYDAKPIIKTHAHYLNDHFPG